MFGCAGFFFFSKHPLVSLMSGTSHIGEVKLSFKSFPLLISKVSAPSNCSPSFVTLTSHHLFSLPVFP